MSEFEEARTLKCPVCGTRYASCEGFECSCFEDREELQPNPETCDRDFHSCNWTNICEERDDCYAES